MAEIPDQTGERIEVHSRGLFPRDIGRRVGLHACFELTESAFHQVICEEPMTGIEPALSAWEAEVLPLNYIGMRHLLGDGTQRGQS